MISLQRKLAERRALTVYTQSQCKKHNNETPDMMSNWRNSFAAQIKLLGLHLQLNKTCYLMKPT